MFFGFFCCAELGLNEEILLEKRRALSRLISSEFSAISGVAVLSGDIYFIDFLPTQLQGMDVVVTVLLALVLSVLATLYPAKKAANVLAAKFLH